jgi:hypothetical protein
MIQKLINLYIKATTHKDNRPKVVIFKCVRVLTGRWYINEYDHLYLEHVGDYGGTTFTNSLDIYELNTCGHPE